MRRMSALLELPAHAPLSYPGTAAVYRLLEHDASENTAGLSRSLQLRLPCDVEGVGCGQLGW